ncbi:MAG: ferredoxin, partial [Bacteroidota bacterium]
MDSKKGKKKIDRREFINSTVRLSVGIAIGSVGGVLLSNTTTDDMVWQLDPAKCVQCGRCATNCVLT